MKAQVNELLLYSRLPFHYWTALKGGRWPFDNPGCSVVSLCAAHLNQHVITVPDEVIEAVDECREFTTSAATVIQLMGWIEAQSERLLTKASSLPQSKDVFAEANSALNHVASLKNMLSIIFGGVEPPEKLDVTQEITVMVLQALIDVKLDIERLEAAVINASTPSTPTKA
jgi:hypothetical protein